MHTRRAPAPPPPSKLPLQRPSPPVPTPLRHTPRAPAAVKVATPEAPTPRPHPIASHPQTSLASKLTIQPFACCWLVGWLLLLDFRPRSPPLAGNYPPMYYSFTTRVPRSTPNYHKLKLKLRVIWFCKLKLPRITTNYPKLPQICP